MTICCVGHGPSLRGRRLGGLVDSHTVVRIESAVTPRFPLRNAYVRYRKHDWGAKTDWWYFGGLPMFDHRLMDANGEKVHAIDTQQEPNLLTEWRLLSQGLKLWPLSSGICMVIMVCHFLRPARIVLAGMDSLLAGDPIGSPYERGNGHVVKEQIQCDYEAEKLFLPMLEARYNVRISALELEARADPQGVC